jgi:anti-anti-sigma regulatory factor
MASSQLVQQPSDTMFTFSRVGHAAVVTIACPAVREWQASVLSNYLHEVVEQHRGYVAVDVGGIGEFTLAWISSLVALSDRCRELGGQMVVIGMSRQSRGMLRGAGLTKRLQMAPNAQEGLAMIGIETLAPWRRAVAKMLSIPVPASKPKAA